MTRAQLNYKEITNCCKYCKHLRSDIAGTCFCSLIGEDDNIVDIVDTCDSFKSIWQQK